jgi:hypothetical protein
MNRLMWFPSAVAREPAIDAWIERAYSDMKARIKAAYAS